MFFFEKKRKIRILEHGAEILIIHLQYRNIKHTCTRSAAYPAATAECPHVDLQLTSLADN